MSVHLPQPPLQVLVIIEEALPLADSRAIARKLDIEHRSFFRTVLTYQQEIEADFGVLRFEIAKSSPGSTGGRPEKYALLTEDQTYACPTVKIQHRLGLVSACSSKRFRNCTSQFFSDDCLLSKGYFNQVRFEITVGTGRKVEAFFKICSAQPSIKHSPTCLQLNTAQG